MAGFLVAEILRGWVNPPGVLHEVDVYICQDNYTNPSEPTEAMTFSLYGVTAFQAQYWTGSAWLDVPGGSVTGNNKVWRKLTFSPITTTKIRVVTNATIDGYSRITELEAWTAGGSNSNINWLVTDQLGTPRMVLDKTGVLGNMKRHDYLPFGEELTTQGKRATTAGYNVTDGVRQKFTAQERDSETGLDYMHARHSSSAQGRFTSADTVAGSISNPQSLNRYAYVTNNPLNFNDPTGHMPSIHSNPKPGSDGGAEGYGYAWDDPNSPQAILNAAGITSADAIVSTQIDFAPAEDPGFVPYYSILYGSLGNSSSSGDVISVEITQAVSTPQNPVPTGELERIRGDVEKSIAGCADFLKALLDETAILTGQPYRDIMVTFDNIKFSYGNPGTGYGGSVTGSFEDGNAAALVRPFESNFISADRSTFIRTQTAQNFLGETLHHVGKNRAYSDGFFANALNNILVRQGRDKPQRFAGRTEAEVQTASIYWHKKVFETCQMRY